VNEIRRPKAREPARGKIQKISKKQKKISKLFRNGQVSSLSLSEEIGAKR
jgi:hypothetical protein